MSGGNKGKPTEKGLYEDARSTIRWIKDQGVNLEDIILYGESLGTGVAVEMAYKNDFNSIILESPFTSIENSAKIYYPYLPIRLLLKDRYDSISKIKSITTPILIMHGAKDDVVPISMGRELFEKANNPKHSYFTKEDDHMMEFNLNLLVVFMLSGCVFYSTKPNEVGVRTKKFSLFGQKGVENEIYAPGSTYIFLPFVLLFYSTL